MEQNKNDKAKRIAMKVVPPLIFIVVFCMLCAWIWSILIQNPTFSSLMDSVEYAADVIINGVEEVPDTLTRAQPTDKKIVLPSAIDSTAQFEVTLDDGALLLSEEEQAAQEAAGEGETGEEAPEKTSHSMYVVFNGISNRQTEYFYCPEGTLTLTAKATGESKGMKSFKIAMWEKLEGQTQYVADTTIYFYTNDETNTYTITGLDPTKEYRINFSYDAYGYYIYGVMQADGVSFEAPAVPAEESADQAA